MGAYGNARRKGGNELPSTTTSYSIALQTTASTKGRLHNNFGSSRIKRSNANYTSTNTAGGTATSAKGKELHSGTSTAATDDTIVRIEATES